MTTHEPLALLFDLDGTIIDPFEGFAVSMDRAMAAIGRAPLSRAAMRPLIGPPLRFSLEALVGPDLVQTTITAYRDHYGSHGLFACHLYPQIAETLTALRERGHVLCLATSKPTRYAKRLLAHFDLERLFLAIEGAENDAEGAIKANVVARALSHLSEAQRRSAMMVGDRAYDVEGARAHDLRCISVTWGYGDPEELQRAAPWAVANHPTELLALIAAANA